MKEQLKAIPIIVTDDYFALKTSKLRVVSLWNYYSKEFIDEEDME